jgi:hypothetical protein
VDQQLIKPSPHDLAYFGLLTFVAALTGVVGGGWGRCSPQKQTVQGCSELTIEAVQVALVAVAAYRAPTSGWHGFEVW